MFEQVPVEVLLCCNNPDNGVFTGRLCAIEVGPNLRFETAGLWSERLGPCLRYLWREERPHRGAGTQRIAISGRYFPIINYRCWFGNWCWDAVAMRGATVLALLNWMKRKPWFALHEAEERLWNHYESDRPFEDHDLRLITKDFRIC